jgi:hypothetical protein
MTEEKPISNVRIFSPNGDGYTDSEMPSDVGELYKLLKGAHAQRDNGLLRSLSGCLATLIALRKFDLLAGFDVAFDEEAEQWSAKLVCVYAEDGERKELSPALSIMIVCVAHANGVVPDLECMKDGCASLVISERIGRYRPVIFTYKPETQKAMDITRAVVLVSPGIVSRYKGSYDIASGTYRDLNEQELKVDKVLLELGGSVK